MVAASVMLPLAASAADYPPATYGEGQVDRSVVHPGECVHFSGGGYAKNAQLTVTDNGAPSARGKADRSGEFVIKVCFGTDARLGPHRLEATGTGANGAPRYVSASVTVVGVAESVGGSSSGGEVDNGSGGGGGGSGTGTNTSSGGGSSAGSTGNGSGTTSGGGSAGAPAPSGPSASKVHKSSSSSTWPLIAGLAAALALLAGGWWLILARRRRRQAEV